MPDAPSSDAGGHPDCDVGGHPDRPATWSQRTGQAVPVDLPPPGSSTATPVPPPPPGSAPAESTPVPSAPGTVVEAELGELLRRLDDDVATLDSPSPTTAPPSPPPPAARQGLEGTRPEQARAAVVESTGGLAFDPVFAGYGERLAGLLADSAVLLAFVLPGVLVAALANGLVVAAGLAAALVGFATVTVWSARSVAASGQFIGNRLTSTRVVDVRNGTNIDATAAGTRFVVRQLVSPFLLIGFLMALGNPQRRTFHDQVAGTVVVRPALASWSIDDGA